MHTRITLVAKASRDFSTMATPLTITIDEPTPFTDESADVPQPSPLRRHAAASLLEMDEHHIQMLQAAARRDVREMEQIASRVEKRQKQDDEMEAALRSMVKRVRSRENDERVQEDTAVEEVQQRRACVECKALFNWDGSAWKTHCEDCYAAKVRHCVICSGNISINAKKWVKMCTDCFVKKKSKTHDVCPYCTGEKATHLRKKFNKPACDECMSKGHVKFFLSRTGYTELPPTTIDKLPFILHTGSKPVLSSE